MPNPGSFGGENAAKQCTAISKRSRERCKGPAVVGSANQKCRMHGGTAETGIAASNFKHGRHSRALPPNIDTLYQQARNNPDLIEMSDHIALLEARIQQVLIELKDEGTVPSWSAMRAMFETLETALLSGDVDKVVPALDAMHKLLDDGKRWDTTWASVLETMEQLRKLTDTEVKRKKELNQMVPVERVVALMAAVAEAVKRHVKSPEEIQAVYREFAQLHGTNTIPAAPGSKRPDNQRYPLTTIDVDASAD